MVDPFDSIFLVEIAPETINGIGGIGNNSSFFKDVCHLAYEPLLRIFRVDLDDHMSFSLSMELSVNILI